MAEYPTSLQDEILGDSQESSHEKILNIYSSDDEYYRNILSSDGDVLNSRFEKDSDEEIDEEIGIINDEILNKTLKFLSEGSKEDPNKSTENILASSSNDHSFVRHFNKLKELKNQIDSSPKRESIGSEEILYGRELSIKKEIGLNYKIPSAWMDLLIHDRNNVLRDWYFITKKTTYQELSSREEFISSNTPLVPLIDLYKKFGVSNEKLAPNFKINNWNGLYTLNKITPVDSMCNELNKYKIDSLFLRLFFCFIMDGNVFNSMNLRTKWCQTIWNRCSKLNRLGIYLDLVPKTCYLLHYKITRLLPIQNLLIDELCLTKISIIDEFKKLLDNEDWNSLLYFILFIGGSQECPFGPEGLWEVFKECIEDMNVDTSILVILSIIRSYINLCLNINP